MSWFRNIPLARKLYGLVGLLLVFLLVVGLSSISSLSSVDQKGSSIYTSNVQALDQLGAANTAVTDEQRLLLQGISYPGDKSIQQATDSELAEFRTSQPERWQRIHDLHEQFHRNAAEVLTLATTGQTKQAKERLNAPDFVNVCKELTDTLQTAIAA